jgi:hypothetical protein
MKKSKTLLTISLILALTVLPSALAINISAQAAPETSSYIAEGKAGKARCKVHKTVLQGQRLEIIYGLVRFKEGYYEAEKKLFPNSHLSVLGGCVIETRVDANGKEVMVSPKYADVLYCPKCREAEKRWSAS